MLKKTSNYLYLALLFATTLTQTRTHWNWQTINTNAIQFPQKFLWGTTAHAYEVEGNSTNNSSYAHESYVRPNGKPYAEEASEIACDHWNRYKEDIQLMKQAGLTSYCFSLEWSKIEPSPGVFNEETLQHYADVCDELNRNNIAPMIILKDYRDPIWFIECGGFEEENNIAVFERYCLKVFTALQGKAYNYITFWAPESYAALAYWNNSLPPFKHSMQLTATVFKNQLEAHVRVYNTLKSADKENKIRIGIVKHMSQLKPWFPWDKLACHLADQLTDAPFYNFFTTGTFKIRMAVPGKLNANVSHINKKAPQSIDFIGINYYSHSYMRNFKRVTITKEKEIVTDLPGFTIYAEGLYGAIKEITERMTCKLNIPMYITQNGIATTSDTLRTLHAKRHLYAVSQAIKAGYNVQGYYYYSLMDGYMWGGYSKKFGLFDVDRLTLTRSLKPGAQYYLDIVNKFTQHA